MTYLTFTRLHYVYSITYNLILFAQTSYLVLYLVFFATFYIFSFSVMQVPLYLGRPLHRSRASSNRVNSQNRTKLKIFRRALASEVT